jgi:glyoxylase-like metal-dependent hydrolase (beta-lactamase superfamily II)
MVDEIITIRLPLPLNLSYVNSYLIKSDSASFLVDTGMTNARSVLQAELDRQGCQKGALKLIILTHGDFDHTGNAVYLRQQYGAKIAMHAGDSGMLENGDMFWNRKFENRFLRRFMKAVIPFKPQNWGKADIYLEDGDSLSGYGLDAIVHNTPGHSTGSICLLSDMGDLFAGDLFTNSTGRPMLNRMMYDKSAGEASFRRLSSLPIRRVYPGHGDPFAWSELVKGT